MCHVCTKLGSDFSIMEFLASATFTSFGPFFFLPCSLLYYFFFSILPVLPHIFIRLSTTSTFLFYCYSFLSLSQVDSLCVSPHIYPLLPSSFSTPPSSPHHFSYTLHFSLPHCLSICPFIPSVFKHTPPLLVHLSLQYNTHPPLLPPLPSLLSSPAFILSRVCVCGGECVGGV